MSGSAILSDAKFNCGIPLLLLLIVAGLLGNLFSFPIFLNIDFLFGSIFAMLALQAFGLGRGIVAAALIASYTCILWNHPYAVVIMTAEVAFVGSLMARRKMGMVLADTVYWLVIGMPMVYVFYQGVMGTPPSTTTMTMIKQAVNGIANALVARLIFTGFTLRSRSSLTSFSEIIYNLLAFFVLCPALIMLALSSRAEFRETEQNIRATLLQNRQQAAHRLDTWVVNRKSAIFNLAEMAAITPAQEMQSYLEMLAKSDANFLRVGLLDKEATITAYAPRIDELGNNNIGKNFAERPFIAQLKKTLKPVLSEVVMGRLGKPLPMVTVLAPVVIQREYAGYITGILRLEQMRTDLDNTVAANAMRYTLLDQDGRIIMTNRSDQTVMQAFVRDSGTIDFLTPEISLWVPEALFNKPISERWKNSVYFTESAIGDTAEWKLILEQPIAPYQKALYARYAGKLTVLFLILLGALALAKFLSQRTMVTVKTLSALTDELPSKLATTVNAIAWPQTAIVETDRLINNFKTMANSLSAQFDDIRRINQSLEQRVNSRTEELIESEERFKALHNASFGGIAIHDQGIILDCNQGLSILTGYAIGELVGMDGLALIAPDWREAVRLYLKSGIDHAYEAEGLLIDGTRLPISIRGRNIPYKGRTVRVAEIRDISERKRLEGLQKDALARLQKITSRVPGVVYQFRLRPDGSSCFPFASEAIRDLYRLGADDIREDAAKMFAALHPDDIENVRASVLKSAQDLSPWQLDYRVKFDDGAVRWLSGNALPEREADGATLWHGFISDVSERKLLEEEVRQLAFYDALTDLPNRRLLNDRLGQAIAASKRTGCYGALMFLDLDNFKRLNDTHGHHVGDLLLSESANRIRRCIREMDTVARFGGDEFVVMLGELSLDRSESTLRATNVAEKIRAALSEPYLLGVQGQGNAEQTIEHHCSASIGVTLFADQNASKDEVLMQADIAMYRAKEAGRNLIRFFD